MRQSQDLVFLNPETSELKFVGLGFIGLSYAVSCGVQGFMVEGLVGLGGLGVSRPQSVFLLFGRAQRFALIVETLVRVGMSVSEVSTFYIVLAKWVSKLRISRSADRLIGFRV